MYYGNAIARMHLAFSFRKSVTVLISFVSDIPVDNNRGLQSSTNVR